MYLDFLLEVFEENRRAEAIVWRGQSYTYGWLADAYKTRLDKISAAGIAGGDVAVLQADFSPQAVACLLALIERGAIVVPIFRSTHADVERMFRIARARWRLLVEHDEAIKISPLAGQSDHPLYDILRERGHPGLVLFSSGTSGDPKGAVHDFAHLLSKYRTRRRALRTLSFLLFDHIGGVNTLLHTLSNAGAIVTVEDRFPDAVCAAIERSKVEVLPTSPTFLNLLLLSEAYQRHDLSSLQLITYGTEPMPEATLARLNAVFPDKQLLQTYGLAEVGILRSKSRDNASLWVRVGGEGFETRVVDGMLEIKAVSGMLGYLNAPSPYTEDGWFKTGDAVEVEGEWLRILGRRSEIINVGGEKVYPAEVEGVIEQMPNVAGATVYGERNALVGNIVCAKVALVEPEPAGALAIRVKKFCAERLPRYKVPVRVSVVEGDLFSERFKKVRRDG